MQCAYRPNSRTGLGDRLPWRAAKVQRLTHYRHAARRVEWRTVPFGKTCLTGLPCCQSRFRPCGTGRPTSLRRSPISSKRVTEAPPGPVEVVDADVDAVFDVVVHFQNEHALHLALHRPSAAQIVSNCY